MKLYALAIFLAIIGIPAARSADTTESPPATQAWQFGRFGYPNKAPEVSLPDKYRSITIHAGLPDDRFGEAVAAQLTRLYSDMSDACPGNRPAWRCAGIIGRGVVAASNFDVLNPSPGSIQQGGVSMSYLTARAKYGSAYYGEGYFIMPADQTPTGMQPFEVLCAFAVDAWSEARAERGCGAFPGIGATGPCRSINVITLAQWQANFRDNYGKSQCGFDVSDVAGGYQVTDFLTTLQAKVALGARGFNEHSEVRVVTWDQDIQQRLPVAAFYYINSNTSYRDWARLYQQRYFERTGIYVPVIDYRLPASTSALATFTYKSADQGVFPLAVAATRANLLAGTYNATSINLKDLASGTHTYIGIPPYEGMNASDRLRVHLGSYVSATQLVTSLQVQSVRLPNEEIIRLINSQPGENLPLYFEVESGDTWTASAQRMFTVAPTPVITPPRPELVVMNGELKLAGWKEQTAGYTLELLWLGSTEHRVTGIATVNADAVRYHVMPAWFRENLGREVKVSYIVRDSANRVVGISDTLTLPIDAKDRLDAPVMTLLPHDAGLSVSAHPPGSARGDVLVFTLGSDADGTRSASLRVTDATREVTFTCDRDCLSSLGGRNIFASYVFTHTGAPAQRSYTATLRTGPP